jgi:hypothetical protein
MSKKAKEAKPVKKDKTSLSVSEQQELEAIVKSTNDVIYETVGLLAGSNKDVKLYGKMVYNQLKKSCRDYDLSKEGIGDTVIKIFTELAGINPKDQIEGMLAVQMIATHHATMDCFRIVAQNGHIDIINQMSSAANKLSRTFMMQMEALNRYRGKGQQKMTVEHVHINSGGQAIIGNITKNNPSLEGGGKEIGEGNKI